MANGGVTSDQRAERRKAVAEVLASPKGLSRVNGAAAELAREFKCSESTIWADRKWLLDAAEGLVTAQDAATEFLVRLRQAQDDAAEDRAHGARIAGLGLEAKVLGVLAAERVDVTVSAEARPLPAGLYELLEVVWRENQAGELAGVSAEALWARFERAMRGPEVLTIEEG